MRRDRELVESWSALAVSVLFLLLIAAIGFVS